MHKAIHLNEVIKVSLQRESRHVYNAQRKLYCAMILNFSKCSLLLLFKIASIYIYIYTSSAIKQQGKKQPEYNFKVGNTLSWLNSDLLLRILQSSPLFLHSSSLAAQANILYFLLSYSIIQQGKLRDAPVQPMQTKNNFGLIPPMNIPPAFRIFLTIFPFFKQNLTTIYYSVY